MQRQSIIKWIIPSKIELLNVLCELGKEQETIVKDKNSSENVDFAPEKYDF